MIQSTSSWTTQPRIRSMDVSGTLFMAKCMIFAILLLSEEFTVRKQHSCLWQFDATSPVTINEQDHATSIMSPLIHLHHVRARWAQCSRTELVCL